MAIKALLVDFYGTLVRENDGLIRDLTRRVCDTSPLVVSPGDVAHFWWETMNSMFRECSGDRWRSLEDLEQAALLEVSARFESHLDIHEALDEIVDSWLRPDVFSDTRTFMSRLPLPICIVANGDSEPMDNAIAYSQLEVQAVVTSEDARSYKPDTEIFLHALKGMNISPGEALYIGDSIFYDMQPAQKAGMYTAWINRTGRPLGGQCLPDVTCDNLQQLRRMIR